VSAASRAAAQARSRPCAAPVHAGVTHVLATAAVRPPGHRLGQLGARLVLADPGAIFGPLLHYWFKRLGFDRQLYGGPEQVRRQAAVLQDLVSI